MPALHARSLPALLAALLLCALALPAAATSTALLRQAAKPVAAATKAPAHPDAALAAEINASLRSTRGLDDVRASVAGGIVRLEGTVLQPALAERARKLAAAEAGVRAVDDRIVVASGLRERIDGVFATTLDEVARLAGRLPLLAVAILIVLLAAWLGRAVSRRLRLRRLNRGKNPYFEALVGRATHAGIVLGGVLLALELLNWTTAFGAIVGSAGVVGLVVGFAFKDIAENYIAGVLLSVRRPFAPGDHIRIDPHEGKVVALTARATVLMTLDGSRLSLPNALVFKSVLLNYSDNPRRRFDFDVTIDPALSIGDAQRRALAAMGRVEGVLADPAPASLVHAFTPAGSVLRFHGWVDQTTHDLGKVRTEALRAVKGDFAQAGIDAPRNVQHVVLQRADALQDGAPQGELAAGDTSVNHDIDREMASAQHRHSDGNML